MSALHAPDPAPAVPSGQHREQQRTQSVLYIEDNESNIHLVERILMERPLVAFHVARTGQEGLDAASARKIDLILLDNRLPDTTGAQVLADLAQSPVSSMIPVIVLTSDAERATAKSLRAAGADDFLAKPFDVEVFLAMVDSYLARGA